MSDDIMLQAVQAAQASPFPALGELVSGVVLFKGKNKCLVDLCDGQAVGIITGRETHDSIGTFKEVAEGDAIKAVVVENENDEGFFVLSLRKAAQNTAWDRFEEMYEKGEVFSVKAEEANKGGLLLEIDSIKAFLPVSQLAPLHYPRVNEANSQEILRRLQKLIGVKFDVKVIAFDRENGKLILSERAAEEGNRAQRLQALKVGDKVQGKISGIVKFGLFVAFDGLEGLVHISEIAWGHVRNPADYGKLGDEIEVQVIGVEGEKISLSIKRLQEDPWVDSAKKFSVGQKIKGKVNRLTSFGAFVTLEKDINGLIHLSEIAHEKVEDIDQYLKVGQEVEAQIINVDLEEHRIGLSIKALNPRAEVSYDAMAGFTDADVPPEVSEEAAPVEETPATEEKTEEAPAASEEAAPEAGEGDDDLSSINGISDKNAEALTAAGYTLEKLKAASVKELVEVEGIGEKTAEKILEAVK